MAFALLTCGASLAQAAAAPAEFLAALDRFRAEGARGWGFLQTTVAGQKSLAERYDPSQPEFKRWSLVMKDGRAPTPEEKKEYEEKLTRRSRGETAPNVKDQLDRDSCEVLNDTAEQGVYRFGLKPTDEKDTSAAFMKATFTLHKPTATIQRVELANTEPFSPVFLVKIQEARTTIEYSLPDDAHPTLLKSVNVRIRGRAMWFRTLDDDMTVSYSEHTPAAPRS